MIFVHLPLALIPPLCSRFFLPWARKGRMTRSVSEWMWRRRSVAASEQKPRRVLLSRGSSSCLRFLLSFLIFIFSLSFLSSPPASRPWYTWRTTVLYVALQDAFSRSSSPYPFSINARRRRLSTTSRGTSLETRVCSCAGRKKKSGSINEIVCAPYRYAGVVPA